jgi:hypothetical protein
MLYASTVDAFPQAAKASRVCVTDARFTLFDPAWAHAKHAPKQLAAELPGRTV